MERWLNETFGQITDEVRFPHSYISELAKLHIGAEGHETNFTGPRPHSYTEPVRIKEENPKFQAPFSF